MIKNPRKLDGSEIKPLSMSVDLNITPLSTASMTLPAGQTLDPRTYVELFTFKGSVGVFRSRSPGMGAGQNTTIQMDHAIAEVGDSLVVGDIEEESTVSAGITKLWTHYKGSKWQLGSVASGNTVITLKANYDSVLDAILDVLEQAPSLMMTFDFTTSPWTVNIATRDTTVTAEGRIGRNVKTAIVTQDDTELCTRVYVEHLSGTSGSTYGHIDADTIGTYGVVEKEISGAENATQATRIANTYLDKHKRPIYSVEIEAVDLSQVTGETLDSFAIGKKYRLALPKYGVTVEETITAMRYTNVFSNPTAISITLSEEPDTVVNYIRKNSRTGSRNSKAIIKKDKEYTTRFDQTDVYIELWAGETATNGDILEQAGMYLDSHGVLIYATDNANMVGSKFQVQANRIGMVIGTYQGNDYIKAGEIALAINNTTGESTAYINATHVDISATNTAHALAGELERDANGKLIIKSAGGMYVRKTESGITSEFGVWDRGNLTGGVMVEQINGQTTTHITGDHINISGTNTVQTLAGAMELDSNGHLVIKDGAGLRLRKTVSGSTAEFGVWDENNLTAGVVATIVNGESSTYISGDKIYIGNQSSTTVINGKCSLSDVTADYIAGKIATIALLGVNSINGQASNSYCSMKEYYGSSYKVGVSGGGGSVTYNDLANGVFDLQITQSGSTYTLQKKNASGGQWTDVGSFSKAVSLSGGWNSGVYRVSATSGTISGSAPSTTLFDLGLGTATVSGTNVSATFDIGYAAIVGGQQVRGGSTGKTGTITLDASTVYTNGKNAVTLNNPTWSNGNPYTAGISNTATVSTSGRPTQLSKTVPVTISQGAWANGSKTVDITTTNGNIVARATVSAPSATLSFDCTDLGSSATGNDQTITATAKHGTSTLGSGTQVIHMGTGSWSSGQIGVTSRLTDANGKCIDRIYVSVPNSADFKYNQTNYSTTGKVRVGSISKAAIAGNTYITFTVGGKGFYIIVNQ